jgi:hypothetical protein
MKGRHTNEKGGEGKVGEGKEAKEGRQGKKREGIGPPTFSNLPPPMAKEFGVCRRNSGFISENTGNSSINTID